eukprot:CAMPEP_0167748226 /NCGR_PEP_ID=MMETSP0110_2-20121227/4724_1 /TAXON_ID=629695 /ORGANISM="Gymnochlora sp., Strain CCMP2014" /LENGTH=752 /DNA_ID=CAMNT_0007633225 /DNA_START=340 /DNA_END=2598 /DNA_ORIENTATION=+
MFEALLKEAKDNETDVKKQDPKKQKIVVKVDQKNHFEEERNGKTNLPIQDDNSSTGEKRENGKERKERITQSDVQKTIEQAIVDLKAITSSEGFVHGEIININAAADVIASLGAAISKLGNLDPSPAESKSYVEAENALLNSYRLPLAKSKAKKPDVRWRIRNVLTKKSLESLKRLVNYHKMYKFTNGFPKESSRQAAAIMMPSEKLVESRETMHDWGQAINDLMDLEIMDEKLFLKYLKACSFDDSPATYVTSQKIARRLRNGDITESRFSSATYSQIIRLCLAHRKINDAMYWYVAAIKDEDDACDRFSSEGFLIDIFDASVESRKGRVKNIAKDVIKMAEMGDITNSRLANKFIQAACQHNCDDDMKWAMDFIDETEKRMERKEKTMEIDSTSYTIVTKALIRKGGQKKIEEWFQKISKSDRILTKSYILLMHYAGNESNTKLLNEIKRASKEVVEDHFIYGQLLATYNENDNKIQNKARKVHQLFLENEDIFRPKSIRTRCLHVVMGGYAYKRGNLGFSPEKCEKILRQMQSEGLDAGEVGYMHALYAWARAGNVQRAARIYREAVQAIGWKSIPRGFVKGMLMAIVHTDSERVSPREALKIYQEALERGVDVYDPKFLSLVVTACRKLKDANYAETVISDTLKKGVFPNAEAMRQFLFLLIETSDNNLLKKWVPILLRKELLLVRKPYKQYTVGTFTRLAAYYERNGLDEELDYLITQLRTRTNQAVKYFDGQFHDKGNYKMFNDRS